MNARRRLVALVAVYVLTVACASRGTAPDDRTEAARLWQTWGVALETSAATLDQVMVAVGYAHGQGQLTDSQLAVARDAGRVARQAIIAGREALSRYAAARAAGLPMDSPAEAVLLANSSLLELLRLAAELGIKYGGGAP